MIKDKKLLFTDLPMEAGIDPLLKTRINGQREVVVIPDNSHAAPGLDALVRAGDWLSYSRRVSVFLNCRDRNRIDLASRYYGCIHLGLHSIIIDSGHHTRQGPFPETRPVYDLDPVQTAGFLKQYRSTLKISAVSHPLIGIRTAIQEVDSFELERMGRICRSEPDMLFVHSDRTENHMKNWIEHCSCLNGFSHMKLILEIPRGQWDHRLELIAQDFVHGIFVKY